MYEERYSSEGQDLFKLLQKILAHNNDCKSK